MIIYKYNLVIGEEKAMVIDENATVVRFAKQGDNLYMWIKMDETSDHNDCPMRYFTIVGTGQPFDDDYEYISSCEDGLFIWHLLEK